MRTDEKQGRRRSRAANPLPWAILVAACAAPPGPATSQRPSAPVPAPAPAAAPAGRAVEPEQDPGLPALDEAATLDDYLRYAALTSPSLRAAHARWVAALERVPQVSALPDPVLSYRYFVEEVETRVGPQQQGLTLAQRLPWFGVRRLRGDVAEARAAALAEELVQARLDLEREVRDAWFEYAYLGRAIEALRRNLELVRRAEGVARARYAVGGAAHPDVVRAQLELGTLEDRLTTLSDRRTALAARLNAALHRPVDTPVPWPAAVPEAPLTIADDELRERLDAANPELRVLAHDLVGARSALELARRDNWPDVTLGVDWIDTGEALLSGIPDSGKDPVILHVSVNLPVHRGRYSAAEREARASVRASVERLEARRDTLHAEAATQLYHLRDAARRIALYRSTLVPKAGEALAATEAAYRGGEASFLDLIDAERLLLELELALERAVADHGQRRAQVERLLGRAATTEGGGPDGGSER